MHPALASSGSFLIQPSAGLTVWTIVVFLISMAILAKWVFPLIGQALDKRTAVIEESIDSAERAKQESEAHEREAQQETKARREQMMEQTRREIEVETRRAIEEIRREVADLTVMATEKVTRKVLSEADQRRLVEEALSELDFSALAAGAEA
jgi:F-type H+-transporting ATPase subunit b